ncbi:hypothetical protein RJ641_031924 [Dillenia turbinata]|uniref:AAA+ ATPase domain-containing protein n=1 Tax=Dillenia turbinata TaxID=194707 RepID=A0AAN8ZHR2_9MAGN
MEEAVVAIVDASTPPPAKKTARRRLIQSTLFPHRSPENENEECDEEEREAGECGESQSEQKRKRRGSRASKKNVTNDKEALNGEVADKVTVNTRSPAHRKEKKRANSTPVKNGVTRGIKRECSKQIFIDPTQSAPTPPAIPDLRQEAKVIAEFSALSRKNGAAERDSECFSAVRREGSFFGPIHVFETTQDDIKSYDWSNWVFHEGLAIDVNCGQENTSSPFFEGTMKSLHLEDFLNFVTSSPFPRDKTLSCQSCTQRENSSAVSTSPIIVLDEEPVDQCRQTQDIEVGHSDGVGNSDFKHHSILPERTTGLNATVHCLASILVVPHHLDCGKQPDDSLWATKYQPENANEVCGNDESVSFINEWLHQWHEGDSKIDQFLKNGDNIMQDADCYSNSDSESVDEETSPKNVLLVTGPVGSGKSAAVYACAKENGFHVIEVNTSDWRNGALVKQRFGEAVESHGLKGFVSLSFAVDNIFRGCRPEWEKCVFLYILTSLDINPGQLQSVENQHIIHSFRAVPNGTMAKQADSDVLELKVSDGEDSESPPWTSTGFMVKETAACSTVERRTLILFEDVDVILDEDRGFIATIQKLAETAKRPMILTSNSNNPALPESLDRLELHFQMPSEEELLCRLQLVCTREKVNIQTHVIQKFIEYCQKDIRKTIMHLQFWCQGEMPKKDRKMQRTDSQLPFDLAAGHQILPKLIPWNLPSQLSEMVEEEIAKSLSLKAEHTSLMEVIEEEELNHQVVENGVEIFKTETDCINEKKAAMLSRNYALDNENEFAAEFVAGCEDSSSGSPVYFTRKRVKKKLDTVLSSDTEDCLNGVPVVLGSLLENNTSFDFEEVDSDMPCSCPGTDSFSIPVTNQIPNCERELEESCCQRLDETYCHPIDDICQSVDVSCVPESSFVPETEMDDGLQLIYGTVSSCNVQEAVSVCDKEWQNHPPDQGGNQKSLLGLKILSEVPDRTCFIYSDSVHGEEIGDSHSEHMEAGRKGYQFMDECSHFDFKKDFKFVENQRDTVMCNSVQETWRKLRRCHTDLNWHLTSEQKDASHAVKLTHGMCNLISEADLLLAGCQELTTDSLRPSMVPRENLHVFNWQDEQLQMTSRIAEHGFCYFAKEIAALGSKMHSSERNCCLGIKNCCLAAVGSEMLASTSSIIGLGKLVREDRGTSDSSIPEAHSDLLPIKEDILPNSHLESLRSIVQSIVPSKMCLALKGVAFHEVRVPRHYLTAGALMLSPEEISLLSQHNCYTKLSSQSKDSSIG